MCYHPLSVLRKEGVLLGKKGMFCYQGRKGERCIYHKRKNGKIVSQDKNGKVFLQEKEKTRKEKITVREYKEQGAEFNSQFPASTNTSSPEPQQRGERSINIILQLRRTDSVSRTTLHASNLFFPPLGIDDREGDFCALRMSGSRCCSITLLDTMKANCMGGLERRQRGDGILAWGCYAMLCYATLCATADRVMPICDAEEGALCP